MSYYSDLFTTSSPGDLDEVLDKVEKVVTCDMNTVLLAEFTASEIESALMQMAPLKPLALMVCPLFFTRNIGI